MDYIKRKEEILTNYFKNNNLKIKIDSICFRNFITRNSGIADDIEAEVYLALSNYNPEKLVTEFDKNPKSLEAIAVTIAKRCFRYRKENPDNPNQSFGTKLLHTSTFRDFTYVSPTEEFNDNLNGYNDFNTFVLFDGDLFDDKNYQPEKWEQIKQRLTPTENEFLEDLLAGKKFYKRKPTNQFKEFRDYVFSKIKNMDLNKAPTPLEQIREQLDMKDVQMFDVMFDEDLKRVDKIKKLIFSEQQYIAQRRILLKKIKGLNIK